MSAISSPNPLFFNEFSGFIVVGLSMVPPEFRP
jgi:hypothetical protein